MINIADKHIEYHCDMPKCKCFIKTGLYYMLTAEKVAKDKGWTIGYVHICPVCADEINHLKHNEEKREIFG